jgi:hypothetical protein
MKYVSIGAQKKAIFDRNHAVSIWSLSPCPPRTTDTRPTDACKRTNVRTFFRENYLHPATFWL